MGATGIAIRPRSTGEVLDDAIALFLGDFSFHLATSLVFLAPAAVSLLILLCNPRPESIFLKLLWPAVTTLLLIGAGLCSALCQDVFQRRSRGEPVTVATSSHSLVASGLRHFAMRSGLLIPYVIAAFIAVSISAAALRDSQSAASGPVIAGAGAIAVIKLVIGPPLLAAHAALTSSPKSIIAALGASFQDGLRQPGKATALVGVEILLFVMAAMNLQLFLQMGLQAAGSLMGLETAFLGQVLSLGNPVYVLAMLLVIWMVTAPFFEAVHFLFHVDSRARHEGLDLWFRVDRNFPSRIVKAARKGAALVVGVVFVAGIQAAESRIDTIVSVREEVHRIGEEQPYPGGPAVQARLQRLAHALDPDGSESQGEVRWFYRAIAGFRQLQEPEAHRRLKEIEQNLALVERDAGRGQDSATRLSRQQLKALLPPSDEADRPVSTEETSSEHKPVRNDDEVKTLEGRHGKSGPAIVGTTWGGLGTLGWTILGAVFLGVIAFAVVSLVRHRVPRARRRQDAMTAAKLPSRDHLAELAQHDPQSLWRRADKLAREGNRLEALRCLYAALLGLLHRAGLIKLEGARTNGEYVRQLHRSCPEPSTVAGEFGNLTGTFERKWYGENSCLPEEYEFCRAEAERIREESVNR